MVVFKCALLINLIWLENALGSLERNVESLFWAGEGFISLADPDLPAGYKRMDENKTQSFAPSKVTSRVQKGVEVEGFILNKLNDFTGFGENMELN